MNHRKLRDGIIIAVCAVAVVITAVLYAIFASNHIFKESKEHLTEIYEQINSSMSQTIESNRKLLNGWNQYIDNSVNIINGNSTGYDDADRAARREEFGSFMKQQKQLWGFTDFYFIGNEHTAETAGEDEFNNVVEVKRIDGEPINIRTRRKIQNLIAADEGGVVGNIEDGDEGSQFMMFAMSLKSGDNEYKNTIDGFEYYAIGISYSSYDMSNALAINVFKNQGVCYVVLPDGNVLLQSNLERDLRDNYLEFLRGSNITISDKNVSQIEQDWKDQKSDTMLITVGDVEYYLTYMPVGFGGWMFIGAVPSSVVNSSMDWFRTVTIMVMAVIFVILAAVVLWLYITTSRRRYKENALEVKSREGLLDMLTENTRDMFIVFSPEDFKAEYVSANVEKLLGLNLDEVRADFRKMLAASVENYRVFTTEGLNKLVDGGVWERDIYMRNIKSEDEQIWFHMSLYRSKINGKDRIVTMFSDRTKERQMYDRLDQLLTIAKNANAAKSNFLSNMSHDIRTPMNAIIGYATLLAKDADNGEKVREYTRKITYSGQHLLSLINDILDMSKIESGKTSLNKEEFRLPEFIEELYSMIIAQTNAKNQTLDVHTKGNIPEIVMGDKLRLNQIMLNILSNAVKYTPEGGQIALKVETMKQTVHNHAHLRFTVADNGIGMSEEYVKTIFEPFSRETTDKTKSIQGTGLGMAITKNIVDLMGGVITVDSEPGKGTTFTVELELEIAESVPEDADFWVHHNVTRVLVVDDEEDVCMDIKELMAGTGVDVEYAITGQDAIKAVEKATNDKKDFHIVLLDWKMPSMDGVETARRIREKVGRDLPIMVLTSYSFDDIEAEARAAGIDLFMSKPFFVSNFKRAVMEIRSDGAAAEVNPEPENMSLKGLKVLAAEDNEINAEILTELLDIEEVSCDIASNGQEAVDKFTASKVGQYDIIFMDIQMPVMNGYEAARAIRASKHKRAKTIPIIAMTANAFDDDVKAAIDSGMNAHLAKPIDMDKLKQLVIKILDETKSSKGAK